MRQKAKMGHLFRIARVAISFVPAELVQMLARFRRGPVQYISLRISNIRPPQPPFHITGFRSFVDFSSHPFFG